MTSSSNCRFSETHEWSCAEGDVITLGLTPFAVNKLTDITYVEMKPAGTKVSLGESIGEVESVKTTSDIYASVDGEILEVNIEAARDPSIINADPIGKGWLVKIRANDASQLDSLMDKATYDAKHPVS
jgi:glycine cleavage system H protein